MLLQISAPFYGKLKKPDPSVVWLERSGSWRDPRRHLRSGGSGDGSAGWRKIEGVSLHSSVWGRQGGGFGGVIWVRCSNKGVVESHSQRGSPAHIVIRDALRSFANVLGGRRYRKSTHPPPHSQFSHGGSLKAETRCRRRSPPQLRYQGISGNFSLLRLTTIPAAVMGHSGSYP